MAAGGHLLPHDLLAGARSVIVFFIPFTEELAAENAQGALPCRNWGLAYLQTNELIGQLGQALSDRLTGLGHQAALTPATHNFDPIKLVSLWSHKHLGHLAGLGRFGHNTQLITPAGCAGRLGSLVTTAELGDSPLIQTEEACLQKAGQKCLTCVKACPAEALTEKGIDRQRCYARLRANRQNSPDLADLPDSTNVCGKCVVMMPCSFENPLA